jgi:hypothetical protein
MLRRLALVRADVSEEPIASIIRVTRIGELGTTLAVTSSVLLLLLTADYSESLIFHRDDGDDTFLRNLGSYKNHMA